MNTTTQQIPSNPALDFAQSVLDVTNNGIELIEILRDIAEGNDEDATTNDRIAATKVLLDRGLGKCPKQLRTPSTEPVLSPVEGSERDLESAESDNHTNHSLDTPQTATSHSVSESPRLVTQIDDTLNQSIGPAPSAQNPLSLKGEGWGEGEKNALDPNSIHFTIQQHILDITNNGQTLRDTLKEIARAKDDPRIIPFHRIRATRLLLDRLLGTDPNALHGGVCPDCRRKWTAHTGHSAHPERNEVKSKDEGSQVEDTRSDEERLAAIEADLNKMIDKGILTPDPNASPIDISAYRMPKDFDITPYAAEEAAAFRAEIELRIERQKQWPEIEERRRKKLEQIYPSHSEDDGDPPDT